MERRERDVLAELPAAYAVALRLLEAGASHDVIAAALDIVPESVPSLLDLARAKAHELLDPTGPACPSPGGPR